MLSLLLSGLAYLTRPRRPSEGRYDWDIAGDAVTWDRTYGELLGGRPASTGGSQDWWIDQIHPEDRDDTVLGLCEALDGPATTWAATYRIRRRDGEYVRVTDRAAIVRDGQGNAVRLTGTLTRLIRAGADTGRDAALALSS